MPSKLSYLSPRKPPDVDPVSVLGFHKLGTYVLSRYRAEAKKKADGPYVPGVALTPAADRHGRVLCISGFSSQHFAAIWPAARASAFDRDQREPPVGGIRIC